MISEKNNSFINFYRSSHLDWEETEARSLINHGIAPFFGWAVIWNPKDIPNTLSELFGQIGVLEGAYLGGFSSEEISKQGRSRKQEPALNVYTKIHPNGHEATGDPWKVVEHKVSAELGFSVSQDTIMRALGRKA